MISFSVELFCSSLGKRQNYTGRLSLINTSTFWGVDIQFWDFDDWVQVCHVAIRLYCRHFEFLLILGMLNLSVRKTHGLCLKYCSFCFYILGLVLFLWFQILSTPVKCLLTSFQFLPAWLDAIFWNGLKRHRVFCDTKTPSPVPNIHPDYSPVGLCFLLFSTVHPSTPTPPTTAPSKPVADLFFFFF